MRGVSSPGHAEWIDRAERAGKLGAAAATALRRWMGDEAFAAHRAEIGALIDREAFDELQDAFGAVIPFGTGGRRGAMGPGPNRINERTIAESAHGLANYVLRSGAKGAAGGPARIVIAYDTRRNSRAFAETAASVVAGNGMEALLFEGPRSTPELSFAVRHLGAAAGIVISASHNPPEDNGFKAYWSDGGQVVAPHDAAIIEEVVKVTTTPRLPLEEAARRGLYREIGREVDGAYLDYVAGLTLGSSRDVRIVFTPLHGTGTTSVAPALREAGFGDVHPLPLQWEADPDFSGVPGRSPNPENPAALDAAVKLAESIGADLVLGSDPDADRLGAVVRHGGAWEFLTGNQIGVLLFEHIARSLAASGTVPARAALLKTCVTSDLLDRIAAEHGIAVQGDYLVGFKYIAEAIGAMPDPSAFVFGIEESHGYLRGAGVRDKDAAQAAVLLAERAAELKAEGPDAERGARGDLGAPRLLRGPHPLDPARGRGGRSARHEDDGRSAGLPALRDRGGAGDRGRGPPVGDDRRAGLRPDDREDRRDRGKPPGLPPQRGRGRPDLGAPLGHRAEDQDLHPDPRGGQPRGAGRTRGPGGARPARREARRGLRRADAPLMKFHHIAIEGPIGVGKTSLVKRLAQKFDAHVVMENVENPFLKDFYEEKAGAAFRTQLFFLLNRYQQQVELAQRNLFQQLTISDYVFAKDKLFAYLNLTDSELIVYERLYGMLEPQVRKQDMVIYLHASTEVLLSRIRGRKRDYESEISPEYINQVNEAYNHYFFHYKESPLLVIDTSQIDFVHEAADLDDLVQRIRSMDRGVQYYNPLPSKEK